MQRLSEGVTHLQLVGRVVGDDEELDEDDEEDVEDRAEEVAGAVVEKEDEAAEWETAAMAAST